MCGNKTGCGSYHREEIKSRSILCKNTFSKQRMNNLSKMLSCESSTKLRQHSEAPGLNLKNQWWILSHQASNPSKPSYRSTLNTSQLLFFPSVFLICISDVLFMLPVSSQVFPPFPGAERSVLQCHGLRWPGAHAQVSQVESKQMFLLSGEASESHIVSHISKPKRGSGSRTKLNLVRKVRSHVRLEMSKRFH